MKDELKTVLIEMIRLKTNGKHDEARALATKFLKEKGYGNQQSRGIEGQSAEGRN